MDPNDEPCNWQQYERDLLKMSLVLTFRQIKKVINILNLELALPHTHFCWQPRALAPDLKSSPRKKSRGNKTYSEKPDVWE
jgi:hypothetical protein